MIKICSFLFQNNMDNIYFEKNGENEDNITENYQSEKQQLLGNEIIKEGFFPVFFVFFLIFLIF
jgi:hypothetical protein